MSGNRVNARKYLNDAGATGSSREDMASNRAAVGTGYALLALADAVERVADIAEEQERNRLRQHEEHERDRLRQHEEKAATARAMLEEQRIRREWEADDRRDAAIRHAERMRARARRWSWLPKWAQPASVRQWSA